MMKKELMKVRFLSLTTFQKSQKFRPSQRSSTLLISNYWRPPKNFQLLKIIINQLYEFKLEITTSWNLQGRIHSLHRC